MAWYLVILAAWMATVITGVYRHGPRALWLVLELPLVLTPFWAVFFVAL
jgi:hypothetical protein